MSVQPGFRRAFAAHGDIVAYIEQADALLSAGETVPLAGLDTAVGALCERILALAPQEAKSFAPQLEELTARLDDLQKKMQTALQGCKAHMNEVTLRQKAVNAYRPPSEEGLTWKASISPASSSRSPSRSR
ncbi:MAG: hypothetical protein WDN72_04000 [Alphaproteobacteria bacterium]